MKFDWSCTSHLFGVQELHAHSIINHFVLPTPSFNLCVLSPHQLLMAQVCTLSLQENLPLPTKGSQNSNPTSPTGKSHLIVELDLATATLDLSFDPIFTCLQCISMLSMEHFPCRLKLLIFLCLGTHVSLHQVAILHRITYINHH